MRHLRDAWDDLQIILKFVGDVISTVILVVIYFTIFALFAIPSRIFADFLSLKPRTTTFRDEVRQFDTIASFTHEG